MEEKNRTPFSMKPSKSFRLRDLSNMTGKDRKTIYSCEERGIITVPERSEGGQRLGYSLQDLNAVRKEYGLLPWRAANDDPMVIAIQNFKGGVGKSVSTVCLSHGLAQKGYRVLVIDMDSQATTTSAFGYIPDHEVKGAGFGIDEEDTVYPFMRGEQFSLNYCMRETNWDQLKLIPSNLQVYQLEYELPAFIARSETQEEWKAILSSLERGINGVKNDFDVILIDSPPSLGMLSLNILQAADALLIPSPPRMYDFSSTVQFLRMAQTSIEKINQEKSYKFIKLMITQYDQRLRDQERFVNAMQNVFGNSLLNNIFYSNSDIQNAASNFKSPYEYENVRKKTIQMIDLIVDEVEKLIRDTWHSSKVATQRTYSELA